MQSNICSYETVKTKGLSFARSCLMSAAAAHFKEPFPRFNACMQAHRPGNTVSDKITGCCGFTSAQLDGQERAFVVSS